MKLVPQGVELLLYRLVPVSLFYQETKEVLALALVIA